MYWYRRCLRHRRRRVLARAGVRPSVRASVRPRVPVRDLRPLSRLRCLGKERRACVRRLAGICVTRLCAAQEEAGCLRPPRNLFRESPERQARRPGGRLYLPSLAPPSLRLPSILPTSHLRRRRRRPRGPLFFHSHSRRCQAGAAGIEGRTR